MSRPATAPASSATRSRMLLEVAGGLGITSVNMNQWAGLPANDWGTLNYFGAARLFFPSRGALRFGVEAGYQYHFWYNYFPGGTSYPYQIDVSATHAAAILRYNISPRITGDFGAGIHMFSNEGGTDAGLLAGAAYHLPLGTKLDGFIGVRADAIFTNPMLIPVVLNVGVGIPL